MPELSCRVINPLAETHVKKGQKALSLAGLNQPHFQIFPIPLSLATSSSPRHFLLRGQTICFLLLLCLRECGPEKCFLEVLAVGSRYHVPSSHSGPVLPLTITPEPCTSANTTRPSEKFMQREQSSEVMGILLLGARHVSG